MTQLNMECLLLHIGPGERNCILYPGMGAEFFIQMFNESKDIAEGIDKYQ